MAIKTKEEIINQLSTIIGERDDDEALTFIEDVTDTLGDFETRVNDTTDWKQKYEENDSAWRAKYKSAFFNGVEKNDDSSEDDSDDDNEEIKIKSFDELFETK